MAEVLGAIASGISVASFAVQLTESVKKLKDFVSTIKNAPEDVKYTIYQLETLNALLNKMDKEIQPSPSMILENANLRECLALCQQGTNTLVSVATGLESDMKRRRRNRLKYWSKSDDLEKYNTRIESAKGLLLMSYMMYSK